MSKQANKMLLASMMALTMSSGAPDVMGDLNPFRQKKTPEAKGCKICGEECPKNKFCCSAEHYKEWMKN